MVQGMQLDIHFHQYQRSLPYMCLALDILQVSQQVLQNTCDYLVGIQLGRQLDKHHQELRKGFRLVTREQEVLPAGHIVWQNDGHVSGSKY